MNAPLHPGFINPVHESQATFRALLNAMARPGTVHQVAAPARPPAPLNRATASVLLTLVDADTPIWLDAAAAEARDWLAFHCGAPLASARDARYAVALSVPSLTEFDSGTDEEPEQSTTLVLQIEALGRGDTFQLTGPGIESVARLAVTGLGDQFLQDWRRNQSRFPRGLDVVLCAGDTLAALPRTVRLEAA